MTHDARNPTSLRLPVPTVSGDFGLSYQPYGIETYYGEVINTLTFRLKDGNRFAKPYHLLHEFEYDPSAGIRLAYADGAIHLEGRNLEPLFTLVCDFRVRWIWEADRPTSLLVPETGTVIDCVRRGAEKVR